MSFIRVDILGRFNRLLWLHMKLLREFAKNYKATYSLKKKYYNITSIVGLASVAVGLAIMLALVFFVAPNFGFDPETKITGNVFQKAGIFIAMISGFALCIYSGVLVVAGAFSFVMYKLGKFTKSEALNYTLYSGYPEYWFEQKP